MQTWVISDLDDCLIKTDALVEQWLVLLKTKPFEFLKSFFWALKGKAYLKHKIAASTSFKAELLPYRSAVTEVLFSYKTQSKAQMMLATASPTTWANAVANHLGIFDQVVGSSLDLNLKGPNKLAAIKAQIGDVPFIYVGDSNADLAIWAEASEIIAVNPSSDLKKKISGLNKPTQYIFDESTPKYRLIIKQLRPHQWVKNALIFLPALAGHKLFNAETMMNGLIAFAGFSLAASFIYILNDLLDLSADRNHHSKKKRPFASGDLPVQIGLILLPLMLLGVIGLSVFLPFTYMAWVFTYFTLNIAYSFYLKQSVMIDIIALSMMYTLRIFAGSAATETPVSEWLLSFSTLFFFSLACVKRYTEITRSKHKLTIDGRGYRKIDGPMIQTLGVASGLLSVLIVLLYLQSIDVRSLYKAPQILWAATPVLLFWISRIWVLTNRDEVHDDPVVFAVKDKISWLAFLVLAIVFGLAQWPI